MLALAYACSFLFHPCHRDVVVSLELLAPSRVRAALQKAVARTSNTIHNKIPAAADADAREQDVFAPRDRNSNTTHNNSAAAASRVDKGGGSRWQQAQAAAANKRCTSLFGFLNYTATSCGQRLLRTNLLQPLTDINTLQLRLDSLQVCWWRCG